MVQPFPTDYASILKRIDEIDPKEYGRTRNYTKGSVSNLSPYVSRGVISTKTILERLLANGHKLSHLQPFLIQLAWRDYFQRVQQNKNIDSTIRFHPSDTVSDLIPLAVFNATTGITSIDEALRDLYVTGYMHNHIRLYVASIVCNIAKTEWKNPSRWMYYHLLDGDHASNTCSWQWVAGSNRGKKYYCNQENINKYSESIQQETFLAAEYEQLPAMEIPETLHERCAPELSCRLTEKRDISIDETIPTLIYNYYNMDPLWWKDKKVNRILLLEPLFFDQYPVSEKCIIFLLDLCQNIQGIQVYTGSFTQLKIKTGKSQLVFKEHPLNNHYTGTTLSRDWLSEKITGYYPSFFGFWKKMEKELFTHYGI